MSVIDYSAIWESTLGQTFDLPQSSAEFSNGLSDPTALKYEAAADLTREQILDKLKREEL